MKLEEKAQEFIKKIVEEVLRENNYFDEFGGVNDIPEDEEEPSLDDIETLQEILRICEKFSLMGADPVAIEAGEEISKILKQGKMPDENLLKKFAGRVNQQIGRLSNMLNKVDQELNALIPQEVPPEDINF